MFQFRDEFMSGLPMTSLLIVYHSQSGASATMAEAAWRGAKCEAAVDVRVMRAWDCGTGHLAAADGVLLVAAENSGSLNGGMKDFLDRTFYPAIARGLVKPYGLLISAGNDGRGAVRQAGRILSGYPFSPVSEPVIVRGEPAVEDLALCSDMGQALATGLAMGIY
jgi:multimeric flavodoxin WrbA